MYDKTITVFNGYASKTTGKSYWYPHILSGVDLITDHGTAEPSDCCAITFSPFGV